jgi:hypothetical protein
VPKNRDLYTLGIKIAGFILRTGFSVLDGMYQSQNSRTGELETMDVGLPFTRWFDVLQLCAKAIRGRGELATLDLADILEIKHSIMKRNIPGALELARKGIRCNPKCAYFYHTITVSADHVAGVRAAKKGLKCKLSHLSSGSR